MIKITDKIFELKNNQISYIMCVNEYGFLENLYFGRSIDYTPFLFNKRFSRGHGVLIAGEVDRTADAGNVYYEYSASNRGDYRTPSFEIEFSENGSGCVDLKYFSHRIIEKNRVSAMPKCDGGETLEVVLKDDKSDLYVALYYTVYEDLNVIVRSAEIRNETHSVVYLDRAYSFNYDFPNDGYACTSLVGAHLRERAVEKTKLTHGVRTLDSKKGESSATMNPFVAVGVENADENFGNVYGFNLIYSGNFELNVELDEFDNVRVCGGVSGFGFRWKLESGESFETPECVLVFSDGGFNKMSKAFHDLYREHLINKNFVRSTRPVVINSWEATYYDFNEERLKAIIDSAESAGIDAFVLDDGWFGKRNDDTSSLGDWEINKEKLPYGLKTVSDYCHSKGLKFGLWFEPEMVSPDSDLFKKHPEWAVSAPNVTPCLGRSQLVLDLSNDETVDFIVKTLSFYIEENAIDYIKWDANRPITENYSPCLPKDRQKEFSHRYILGLYKILKTITDKYPKVLIEGCASGGCRFDAGILKYCPQIWVSDNTDAYSRMNIQRGTAMCYPLSVLSNHVSVCPNHQTGRSTKFKTRFDVASFGVLGYELDISELTEECGLTVRENVERYKKDEDLILNGDYYVLRSSDERVAADMVVAKDKERAVVRVLYGLVIPNSAPKSVKLVGLNEAGVYVIEELGVETDGRTLMNKGVFLPMQTADFDSCVYHIRRK